MENSDNKNVVMVKKSTFKQKTKRNMYKFATHQDRYHYIVPKTEVYLCTDEPEISNDLIFTCNLEMPMLEIGESFYIAELDLVVRIEGRIRCSDNSVCYQVQDKYIEDEMTKKSEREAKELQAQALYNEELAKKCALYEWKLDKIQKSFWYKFIKIEE